MPVVLIATAVAAVALVLAVGSFTALKLNGWWRLVAVPAALGVVVFVAFPAVVAVSITHPAPIEAGDELPSDHGLDALDVTLRTEDGVELAAWYVASANGAAVVLLHGSGGNRSKVLEHAAVLSDAGYGVLALDARGHGESDGDPNLLGWHGDGDVAAAVDHLSARPDVDANRIAVVGMSMGGEEAIGAAAADPRIRAVVAEGATGRVRADDAWRRPDIAERLVTWSMERLVDALSSAEPPTRLDVAVTASDTPMLLIAGDEVEAEVTAAARLHELAPSSVSVWVSPGGHTEALHTNPPAWTSRVDRFLTEALS